MKNKGSASIYEVLKSATSRPSDPAAAGSEAAPSPAPDAGAGPTLQERLAAYKAAKLAAATQPAAPSAAVAVEEPGEETPFPEPSPVQAVVAPAAPASILAGPAPATGPGERVLRVTYNTAVFAGLVGLGLLFVAYALGVQSGKRKADGLVAAQPPPPVAPPVSPRPPVHLQPPPPPPPAPREYTIRLAEWRYGTAQERLKADAAADDLKRALDRATYRGAKKEIIQRAGEPRLALYLDTFTDPSAPAVKSRFAAIQKLKVGTQSPFAQAQIEPAPR
jgi:hypothetical protein